MNEGETNGYCFIITLVGSYCCRVWFKRVTWDVLAFFGFLAYLLNGCRVESDVDRIEWIVCGVGRG